MKREQRDAYYRYIRPKMRLDRRTCAPCGKVCYPSPGMARAAAKNLASSGRERSRGPDRPLNVYPCPACEAWHVGHSSPPGRASPFARWTRERPHEVDPTTLAPADPIRVLPEPIPSNRRE